MFKKINQKLICCIPVNFFIKYKGVNDYFDNFKKIMFVCVFKRDKSTLITQDHLTAFDHETISQVNYHSIFDVKILKCLLIWRMKFNDIK